MGCGHGSNKEQILIITIVSVGGEKAYFPEGLALDSVGVGPHGYMTLHLVAWGGFPGIVDMWETSKARRRRGSCCQGVEAGFSREETCPFKCQYLGQRPICLLVIMG